MRPRRAARCLCSSTRSCGFLCACAPGPCRSWGRQPLTTARTTPGGGAGGRAADDAAPLQHTPARVPRGGHTVRGRQRGAAASCKHAEKGPRRRSHLIARRPRPGGAAPPPARAAPALHFQKPGASETRSNAFQTLFKRVQNAQEHARLRRRRVWRRAGQGDSRRDTVRQRRRRQRGRRAHRVLQVCAGGACTPGRSPPFACSPCVLRVRSHPQPCVLATGARHLRLVLQTQQTLRAQAAARGRRLHAGHLRRP